MLYCFQSLGKVVDDVVDILQISCIIQEISLFLQPIKKIIPFKPFQRHSKRILFFNDQFLMLNQTEI